MLIPSLRSFFRNRFHRRAVDERLDTELQGYVDLAAAGLVARGVAPDEAQRQAVMSLGGVEDVKERVRDARAGASLDSLLHDLRLAIRGLRRSPVFAFTTVVTLGLGLGAALVVLAIADAVLVRPLPYRDADALVTILQKGTSPVSPANFADWRAAASSFTALEAAEYWTPTLSDGTPEEVAALHVTPGMIDMLGATPLLGRTFSRDVDGAREIIISHALWQRRFASDTSIVGRTIRVDNEPFHIIGVMRPGFQFAPYWATAAEAWAPLALARKSSDRDASSLRLFGRLRAGATIASAQREMDLITSRLARQFPESNRDIQVVDLKRKAIGNARPALVALVGAVVFVLLITWVNVAHMLLARAYAREKEISVRVALGASRLRIVREALAESVVLATAGGALAVIGASFALAFIARRGPFDLPQLRALTLDGRALAIAAGLSVVTAMIVGVLPGWMADRASRATGIRLAARGATSAPARTRLRQALIASEMAFAVVLLVGTALMVRTFAAMRAVDPGFDPAGVVTMHVPVPRAAATPAQRADWFTLVRDRLVALPGVSEAGFINHIPLAGDEWGTRAFGGVMENAAEADGPRAVYRVATPGYIETMRIRRLEGRDIEATDDLQHPGVVVINRRLARLFWPGRSAVGQRITFEPPGAERSWLTVVGVVEDVKQSQWVAAADPEVYLPFAQTRSYLEGTGGPTGYLTLVVRADGRTDPAPAVSLVRGLMREADPTAAVTRIEAMDDIVRDKTARARFIMSVLVGFGALALVLAAVGIYGVLSYSVSQRRQELGIRMALGASGTAVMRAVAAQTAWISMAGIAVGTVVALLLTRLIAGQLYGVSPADPASFVAATVALGVVALLGAAGPARQAVRIDPLTAIRSD